MEEERDGGDENGGESVTNPIPIVGGKMKKRGVEYKCESCNKVGWFDFFKIYTPFYVWALGFLLSFLFPFFLPFSKTHLYLSAASSFFQQMI